ncbi:unnamed protein product [Scytosiphon promiscuus]
MVETSTSYERARASVDKATRHFADVETIGAKDVLRLKEEGKKVLLVDVRTEQEMEVSMLRGALSRQACFLYLEDFESSNLGEWVRTGQQFQSISGEGDGACDVVVPYCTVGYRSGQYVKKLVDLGYPSVKNSEGVVLWTHDVGSGLIAPAAATTNCEGASSCAPQYDAGDEVKRVHVYGSPWDHAHEDYETIKFTPKGWLGSTMRSAFSKIFGKRKS